MTSFNRVYWSESMMANKIENKIKGYDVIFIDRINKRGGGVALKIGKSYGSAFVSSMSLVKDNIMEYIMVEIEMEK